MPLYEYQCSECDERVEIIQRFSDPVEAQCPKCGAAMKKLMSAPAIQFKGTGWYKTDYAAKNPSSSTGSKSDSKTDSRSDSKSESTAESKTESKTETKSETKRETKSD